MRYHKGVVLLDLGSERGPNFGTKNNPRFYADKLLILGSKMKTVEKDT